MKVSSIVTTGTGEEISAESYGGKARGLSLLAKKGYNVPYSVFLPTMSLEEFDCFFHDNPKNNRFLERLLSPMRTGSKFNIAIRSSATFEDSGEYSHAGRFNSFLGIMSYEEIVQKIRKVIESLGVEATRESQMAVVIQKRITAAFSGVTFSSDPITGSRTQCISSVISGMGEPLVSGKNKGEDIVVTIREGVFDVPIYQTPVGRDQLITICKIAKKLERDFQCPVDIEWCVSPRTKDPFILQCRPVTGIFSLRNSVLDLNAVDESRIPTQVLVNPKISLRVKARKAGLRTSNTYLVTMTRRNDTDEIPEIDLIKPSKYWNGYSIVLVYPPRISGRIVRCFLGDEYLRELVECCQRYTFRAYPKYSQMKEALKQLTDAAFKDYWLASVMIQEIYKAKYTGVCKRITDGYVIEVAKGYFVPKGIVQVSRYLLDLSGNVLSANEVHQDRCIRIIGGYIIEQELEVDTSLVQIKHSLLSTIVQDFQKMLTKDDAAIEFGLFEDKHDGQLVPYVIDIAQDKPGDKLSREMLTDGVISGGTISGEAIVIDPEKTIKDSLEVHLYDELEKETGNGKTHIILCQKPDISFLKLIQKHPTDKLGFAFAEGSVLCHLAIVLREKGIPAAVIGEMPNVESGKTVTLDCTTRGLKGTDRLKIGT